jgi:hypothetical protein
VLVYATRSLRALVGARRAVSKGASTGGRAAMVAVIHDMLRRRTAVIKALPSMLVQLILR